MTSMNLARESAAPAFARLRPSADAGASPFVREETAGDVAARERLLDDAFGEARFAKTSERLRAGRTPARGLALSAVDDGELVGTVRLWNVNAGGRPALLLGPLAVADSHRSLGVGGALMRAAIARAKALGHGAILLVGDAPYYRRFGFEPGFTQALDLPGPVERARFLGLELREGALAGASGMVAATGPRASRALRRRAPAPAFQMAA
ncbi:MAG: N-acetyltransferase [Hyphomicrobiales bacterium]|nr:N-acetyltransferase [Hyphomicrobiales bacterium]